MLHLALRAFAPREAAVSRCCRSRPAGIFARCSSFADATAKRLGLELLVHSNEEGTRAGVKPWTHGASYADIMLTQALKEALDQHGFDAAFGGGRRDEEKSRAKERIFSFRSAQHRWDPKKSASRALAPLQHAQESRREHSGLSAVELDRARHLAVHPCAPGAHRSPVFREGPAHRCGAAAGCSWSMTSGCPWDPRTGSKT